MDKETLVTEIRAVLDSFLPEGKDFTFAALVPVYPGLPSTSYILLLNSEWLQERSIFESIKIITERIFKTISNPKVRQKIDSVDVWQKGQSYPAGVEAIIIIDDNKISRYFNYAPTLAFSGSLFSSSSLAN
ncbi:MAG: hypothetical protein ACKVT2_04265 [Saprospiraceae bacterium]